LRPFSDKTLMTDERPVLDYSTLRASTSSDFELQQFDGQVRVLFPVLPKWIFLVPLAATLVLGIIFIAGSIRSLIAMWQIRGLAFHFSEWFQQDNGLPMLALAALSFAVAAVCYLAYRQWTRELEVLVATPAGLLWSKRGLFGRRSYWWPVEEIAAIELRRAWGSIELTGAVRWLIVRYPNGQSQRFFLRSGTRRLPQTIAERYSEMLGRPLK
jgi:hypothetical protein